LTRPTKKLIGREVERAALIAKGVEEEFDAVVGVQRGVARHLRSDDAAWIGIERDDADVEVVVVSQQGDRSGFGGRLPRIGLALNEVTDRRRRAPVGLVQAAVHRNRSSGGRDLRGPDQPAASRGRLRGCLSTRAGNRGNDQRGDFQAPTSPL
jgi:hypothetical protein